MVKNKKSMIIIGIIVITLLEMYFGYMTILRYKGIYRLSPFVILLFQPLLYARLLRNDFPYKKARILILLLISVLLPLLIYSNLPKYSYADGEEIIKESLKENEDPIFVELSFNDKKIPVTDNTKQLYVADRFYYYKIEAGDKEEYFVVDPLTGESSQLTEDYWKDGE